MLSLLPKGGIALHEGPTRRRHVLKGLHVVQTPHYYQCGGHRMTGGPDLGTHGRRNPTPWNKGGATARENSPYRSHIAPLAGQNSPCSHKMAQFGRFYPCRENFIPLSPATSPARANFLPHQPQHHHGLDRNDAPTRHTKRRNETFSAPAPHTPPQHETFIAPARHKLPKITHFPHAGANFLSQHTPPTQHAPTPGRFFFQPPKASPSEPTVACNSHQAHPDTTS